jgi:hypothetical protein
MARIVSIAMGLTQAWEQLRKSAYLAGIGLALNDFREQEMLSQWFTLYGTAGSSGANGTLTHAFDGTGTVYREAIRFLGMAFVQMLSAGCFVKRTIFDKLRWGKLAKIQPLKLPLPLIALNLPRLD